MAEEIKKVISIDTGGGAKNLKDLIAQVEKLREILKTLDSTSEEYKSTLGELKTAQDKLTSSLKSNKQEAEAAEGSYNALSRQMRDLKKEWKATSDEAERNALGKQIKGINDQLKALDQSIGNNQRNVGNYAGSFQSLKEEIRQARDIMAGAARGSDEYAAAAKRAAEASDKLRDMQKEIANGASGMDNQFAVMSNLLGSVSGGFAAAQGAMALFGAESENLQKTFVKLQAAMSMTQGFKALAELPKGLNAAKIAFAGVTTGVKNFTKSLTLVKGAIAATGIGVLLILLGELIAHWDTVSAAVSNFVGGMDGLREKLAGVANVIKNFITGPIKALKLAFQGNFKEAFEAFKDGFKVSANYSEGVQNQMVKNTQRAEQKKREEFDKTRDEYIKDMEAQKGADWKYSKEGQKAYREFYNNKLAMYKKDSEEYKKAQREMWAYERDLKGRRGGNTSGGSGNAANELKEDKEYQKRREAALQEYYDKVLSVKEKENKLYQDNLARYEKDLKDRVTTQEEYNKLVEAEEKRHQNELVQIAKDEREEQYKVVLESLKKLQSANEKELAEVRAYIAEHMFPGIEEAKLQGMKLSQEGIPKFIREIMSESIVGLGVKLNDLNTYMETGDWIAGSRFNNLVFDVKDASAALDAMRLKFKEFRDAVFSGAGEETTKKLEEELEDLVKVYKEKMQVVTQHSIEDLNNLASKTVGDAEGWLSTFFDWRFEKGEKIVEKEIENNNLELASFIATSEARIDQISKELEIEGLADEEKIRLIQELETLKREEVEKTAEIEKRNSEVSLNVVRQVENSKKALISNTLDALANTGNILMNWSDTMVKKETKNGKEMSKEKERQAKTMFNVGKALAISETVVSTYQGAQEAFTSLASIPYVGPALGIAAAAAAVTAGILRIQSIASQEFGNNGNISDNGGSVGMTSAVAVPQLESTPYSYTSTITNASNEDELNRPIFVTVTDIQDGLKVSQTRKTEVSF